MVARISSRTGVEPAASTDHPRGGGLVAGRLVGLRDRARPVADRLVRLEPWLVLPCVLALLLYPNPLVAPAALVGALPSLGRWLVLGRPWTRTAFDLPLLLLLGGALLGAYAGLSRGGAAMRLCGLLAGVLMYVAVLEHARTARQLRGITLALLVIVTVGTLALVAIAGDFLRLDRAPPLAALVEALEPLGKPQGLGYDDALSQRYRFYPSGVGALADVGLALVFAVAVGARSWRVSLALLPLALYFAAVVLVSDNRGSMLSGAITLAAVAGFWRPRLLPLIPLAGLAMLVLIASGLVERGLDLRTVGQRFWFWENSLYLAQELPFTGAGLGTQSVQLTYKAYFQPSSPPFSHAHNIYLQSLLEQGVFGLLGLVGLTLATLRVGWSALVARQRGARARADRWVGAAALAGLGGAIALFSTGLSEISAVTMLGGTLLLTLLGLLAATARVDGGRWTADDGRRGRVRPPSIVRRLTLGRRGGLVAGAVALAALLALLIPTGLAARGVAAVALNLGTLELNRATLSEDTGRNERPLILARAVGLLRTAADLGAPGSIVQRSLALALAAQDDERGARAAAGRARAATDPADPRGQFQLGRAYVATRTWSDAIRAWEAAGAAPQLVQLGHRLVRARNWEQSFAAYTAAARVQPRSRGPYEAIARAAEEHGEDTEETFARFEPLISLGGWNEYHAHLQIAAIHREAGRLEAALESVRAAERIAREGALLMEEGLILARLERWAQAEPLLRVATEEFEDDAEPFYWLGLARSRLGLHEAAIAAEQEGLTKLDASRTAKRGLYLAVIGDSLLALGRPADALAAYEQAAKLRPGDPQIEHGAERARAALGGVRS